MTNHYAKISKEIVYYARNNAGITTDSYISRAEADKAAKHMSESIQSEFLVQEFTTLIVRVNESGVHAHPCYDRIYILGDKVLQNFDPQSELRKRALAKLSPAEISALRLDVKLI